MFALNKCLFSFNYKNFVLINELKLNLISTKPQKRCLNSIKTYNNFNQFCNHLSENGLNIRHLSSINSWKAKTENETKNTSVGTVDQPMRPSKEWKGRTVESIGIAGINDMKHIQKNVDQWICVYHFPYIVHIRTLQRLKLWLTVIAMGLMSTTTVLYAIGSIPFLTCYFYTMCCLFSIFMSYFFGHMLRRFVGRIYISQNQSMVRLSHLSFFGNRLDVDVEATDVVPLIDSNHRLNDFYCRIERYSNEDLLYMCLKYGGITDRQAFDKVFGEDSHKYVK